ncbi:MAG: polyprenyl synthetase family protein [Candidatus Omnitrophica bacterium]|nr:polyprenyl synthetase family protein [Candidatus Omnitrophota bacterium]
MIDTIRAQIEKNLVIFLNKVEADYHFKSIDPNLYHHIREYCLRKGKRIRPILLILSYKGYSSPGTRLPSSIYYASTCVELLHNFMLIHDDIIDKSDLRRGKPTMHKLLEKSIKNKADATIGSDLGIIAGDIVYALAIDAFLCIKVPYPRKEQALKFFIQTAAFTALGEFIDTLHGISAVDKINTKDVYLNYTLKTARYTFVCPLIIGAILAGTGQKEIKKLDKFGLLIGQAFQIQDDIIGIYGVEKNIGKSILSDLAESKKTLLVAHASTHFNAKEKIQFLTIFNKKKKTHNDLLKIQKLFISSGTLSFCLDELKTRRQKAAGIMQTLAIKDKEKKILTDIVSKIFVQSQNIEQTYLIDQ